MNTIRRSADRGHADHGWLSSHHSFSFADYHDPEHVEFGPLRVINEDRVVPGAGFGAHGHRDMEIISYVLSGALAHQDSLGNGSTLRPGDVQRMSAGTGIRHSEFNGSNSEPVHFLQIWIQPSQRGLAPSYEETRFEDRDKRGRLRLIASPEGSDRSVRVHQDVRLYAGLFDGDAETAVLPLAEGRRAYVHVVRGGIEANGHALSGGDALEITGESTLRLEGGRDAEVLVFDLPGA
jgi:redox-sensitive bicupin YhaK (pirin superfamily)